MSGILTPPLGPLFYFFGGKFRSSPRYPAPAHDCIVEPFAGSAGYAMRHHERDVVLVERDPQIAALWRWLVAVDADEVRSLPDVDVGQDIRKLPISDPAKSLIGFWSNKGHALPRGIA